MSAFFFYFFFPLVLNIQMNVFFTVVLTYVLNYAAYFAEIYRGGIWIDEMGRDVSPASRSSAPVSGQCVLNTKSLLAT